LEGGWYSNDKQVIIFFLRREIGFGLDVLSRIQLGFGNPLVFALLLLIKRLFGLYSMFCAQHDWSSNISSKLSDIDWVKYNALTSGSVQGEAMRRHPIGALKDVMKVYLRFVLYALLLFAISHQSRHNRFLSAFFPY
jgi:hypothetical protein